MKIFTGVVISAKMDKTAVVEVTRRSRHPLYKKIIKRTKKYFVHDENNKAQEGTTVSFMECPPISKNKRFMIIESEGSR